MKPAEVIFSMCGTGVQAIPGGRNIFDPATRTIYLTKDVYQSSTSRALAIVAHECAHSQQPTKLYMILTVIFQATLIALFMFVLAAFFIVKNADHGLLVGSMILAVLVVSRLLVLYFEFDASLRAYRWLRQSGRVNLKIARKVLTDSFLTYLNIR